MTLRRTHRKDAIWQVIGRGDNSEPLLLEELRWMSLKLEYHKRGTELLEMSRSLRNSFARTIRDHISELHVYKLPRPERLPSGLVARAAVYRLNLARDLTRFLEAKSPEILMWYGSHFFGSDDDDYRAIPYVGVSLHPDASTRLGPIIFHVGSPISIVSRYRPDDLQLERMANVKWTLYRTYREKRRLLAYHEPVEFWMGTLGEGEKK